MKNVYCFISKEAGLNAVVTGSKPSNVYNLSNVRREGSRHFRNKKKVYLKAKIGDLKLTVS
jgi:hypothetical protein